MGMSYWRSIRDDPIKADKYRAYMREWKRTARAKQKLLNPKPQKPVPSENQKKEQAKLRRKIKQAENRDQVFGHYGRICCRCGESDLNVLTIDHTSQDGYNHKPGNRKRRISGYQLYDWLIKQGLPPGYRTACANCQIRFYREHRT
ncbi:hypothetical protein EBU71_08910 [bacterium]|nr:hypothetical protein [Candidatus Elulimicrobium humile]